jgi:hypothetical protein
MKCMALLTVLAQLPAFAAIAGSAVSIPFTTDAEGMVVLPAALGSAIPIRVLLDTGAGQDVVAPSLIGKVNGKAAGELTGLRMFGDPVRIPLFVIPELSVGSLALSNVTVGSWDVLDKMHTDAILSMNDFRSQPLTLDFPGRVMVLESAQTLTVRRRAGHSAPLELDDLRGISLSLFARFVVANQPMLCEIDTGGPNTTISTRYMTALGVDPESKDVKKTERRAVESGATITRYWTTLPQISLAGVPQVALAKPRVSFSDIIYDCVVGRDFWQNKVLTIDIANRQLIAL